MKSQRYSARSNQGRAKHARVFDLGSEIEISKFDKQARQDYVLVVPKGQYGNDANRVMMIAGALPNLSEQQREFLRNGLTPAEQRIVRDPEYQQAVESLRKASAAAFELERSAILNRVNSSQLEPYDYHLSLRHQAFNATLHERSDINQTIREINWIKDISQAQYRSQVSGDPSFTPEKRLTTAPNWVEDQLKGAEKAASPVPKSINHRGKTERQLGRAASLEN